MPHDAASVSDPDFSALDQAGLNLHAVFDLAALPAGMRDLLDPARRFCRVLLVGHGGQRLWEQVQASGIEGTHPIDDFSLATVSAWIAENLPQAAFSVLYPGEMPVGLQALGRLAGWHHESPFRLGINERWGSWFAYRVAVLVAHPLPPTPPEPGGSPCEACTGKPCLDACPAGALAGEFSLEKCIAWRRQPDSSCRLACLARNACPVRAEHRYLEAQIAHSYGYSLRMIEACS